MPPLMGIESPVVVVRGDEAVAVGGGGVRVQAGGKGAAAVEVKMNIN